MSVASNMTEERLKRLMTELYNCGFDAGSSIKDEDTRHDSAVQDDILAIFSELDESPAILTRQVEALAKRVAELDSMNATLASKLADLQLRFTQRVSELKSQLAWTPVEKGLPTEPGFYVFMRALWPTGFNLAGWELRRNGWYYEGELRPAARIIGLGYRGFRRIELPEAP